MDKRWLYRAWRWLPEAIKWPILWATNAKFVAGVMGLALDAEGRVLLLRHDYRRQGQWGLPGGWLKAGEGLRKGLAREFLEETGLQVEVGGVLAVFRAPDVPRLDIVYHCRIAGGCLSLGDEIAAARFFRTDELPAGMFPEQEALIRQALQDSGS